MKDEQKLREEVLSSLMEMLDEHEARGFGSSPETAAQEAAEPPEAPGEEANEAEEEDEVARLRKLKSKLEG